MQHLQRIDAIERRAEGINLTLCTICQRAEVPVSTVWRWKRQLTSPIADTVERHLAALERVLETAERDIRRRVA